MTVRDGAFESARPSAVQIAPATVQSAGLSSVTVTSFQALAGFGVTVTV